jgi:hypothetical protein
LSRELAQPLRPLWGLLASEEQLLGTSHLLMSCGAIDGIWVIMPGGGVKASTPAPSCLVWEMGCQGHVEQI